MSEGERIYIDSLNCIVTQNSPVFINVGRADIITEKSLLDALSSDVLSGAILDVFATVQTRVEGGMI